MARKIFAALVCLAFSLSAVSCAKGGKTEEGEKPVEIVRVDDERGLDPIAYTAANLSATDKTGRELQTGDKRIKDRYVGLFYHIWQGYHTKTYKEVLDITEQLNGEPDVLWDMSVNAKRFHFWGQPLYGYYCSYDPWITNRHVELLTMSGIDYLVYDVTNTVVYDDAINAMFAALDKYRLQGWNVPKVAFYCNSGTPYTVKTLYNTWYAKNLYPELWFSFDQKPLIICDTDQMTAEEKTKFGEFFDMRESQWPYGDNPDYERGFPWMDWDYPQKNYGGTISVSLAQHPGARMSKGKVSNRGRGFDYNKYRNYTANAEIGTNLEGQWKTVFENNADQTNRKIDNVFVTGFNEWQAQKLNDGEEVFFVDTFNEEYSRDIEMMKGGYDDNYLIQNASYVRRFGYTAPVRYTRKTSSVKWDDFDDKAWDNAAHFKDFIGDAIPRNHADAFGTTTYTDNSNRNDITDVKVAHDSENLYVSVKCAADVTAYNGTDKNWMTLLIKTFDGNENTFGGFDRIVGRTPTADGRTSVEKSTGGYSWTDSGSGEYRVSGDTVFYKIPLSSLGLTADDCYVRIKATDNVTKYDDIMDYYVSGDCAPIGRFAYSYGY